MVITISAYTEPIPPPDKQVYETPSVNEIEEDEEQSDFAQILAGLLRKNETPEPPEPVPESFDGAGIDALADFSGAQEAQSGLLDGIGEAGITENTPAGIEIPQDGSFQTELSGEYKEVVLSAEHLFAGLEPVLPEVDAPAPETSVKKPENFLTETEPFQNFSSISQETEEIDFAEETYASVKAAEDTSFSRIENKKDKAFIKDENIPPGDKEKKAEDLYFANKKNETPGRLDEMRSRSRKDKVAFDVRDMRTGTGAGESAGTRPYSTVETSAGRAGSETTAREITLELRLPDNPSQAQSSSHTTWEVKAGNALENMLARELHQNFNGDIVRHASMALRDGGEGTIKISLKPESLGNVKIRLEMTENKITGHIVVESEEALNAFRKEISSLEQAFRDSGFSNADLNLSLNSEERGAWQEQEESSFTRSLVSSRYESSFEQDALTVDVFYSRSGSVNLFA